MCAHLCRWHLASLHIYVHIAARASGHALKNTFTPSASSWQAALVAGVGHRCVCRYSNQRSPSQEQSCLQIGKGRSKIRFFFKLALLERSGKYSPLDWVSAALIAGLLPFPESRKAGIASRLTKHRTSCLLLEVRNDILKLNGAFTMGWLMINSKIKKGINRVLCLQRVINSGD